MKYKRLLCSLILLVSILLTGCSVKDLESKVPSAKHIVDKVEKFFGKEEEHKKLDAVYMSKLCDITNKTELTGLYTSKTNLCLTNGNIEVEGFKLGKEGESVALFDITNSKVIAGYNLFNKVYPASTTKIMTLYVALNHIDDLNAEVTVSENIKNIPKDSTKAWLKPGDKMKAIDLLYSMMLPSGNDAAIAVSEYVSGSVEEFTKLMNEEALKLGASKSHFANPHGLENADHYTTPYDMYLIFNEAIKNKIFCDIVACPEYKAEIISADGSKRKGTWKNTNEYIIGKKDVPSTCFIDDNNKLGGKTGTTDEAGCCLIQFFSGKNGNKYIAIVMNAKYDKKAKKPHDELYKEMNNVMSLAK